MHVTVARFLIHVNYAVKSHLTWVFYVTAILLKYAVS